MKKRIKTDSSILSFVIIVTGFLYLFPGAYSTNPLFDNILDFFGIICIIKGTLLRIASRSYKRLLYNKESTTLVASGPYSISRNPMYLGSCMIGCGFVLLIWPWFMLPVFIWLFYQRFKREVVKEEAFLEEKFGDEYKAYCEKVPRIFPKFETILHKKVKEVFNLEEAFRTREPYNILAWMALAMILESFQEIIIFGFTEFDLYKLVLFFVASIVIFSIGFAASYKYG